MSAVVKSAVKQLYGFKESILSADTLHENTNWLRVKIPVSFSNRKQHLDSADKFDLGSWNAIVKFVWFVCKNHATSQSPD